MDKVLTASRFKAQCLALLDEVAETGQSLVVTKHGRPVARLAPLETQPSLRGSVTFNTSDEELVAPLEQTWDAAAP